MVQNSKYYFNMSPSKKFLFRRYFPINRADSPKLRVLVKQVDLTNDLLNETFYFGRNLLK